MKKIIILTLFYISSLISFGGCTQDTTLDSTKPDHVESGAITFVIDAMDVATQEQGSGVSTKASGEPSTTVQNMWIVQYDESEAYLESTYYDSFDITTDNAKIVMNESMTMMVFIANTFDSTLISTDGVSRSDLKSLTTSVSTPSDVLGDGSYFVLNGEYYHDSDSENPTVTLKRNVAKVNIIMTRAGLSTSINTLDNITVYNISNISRVYTNYGGVQEPLEYSTVSYTLTADELTDAFGDSGVTLYLPVNEQGTNSENSDSQAKVTNAPENATYIVVKFTNDFGSLFYTFYLGANMITDYNLSANNAYYYTFDISSTGNVESDSRVDSDIEYIPMVNVGDITQWKSDNADNSAALAGLVTDYFDFEYTVDEVYGTNWMLTSAAITNAAMDPDTGKATGSDSDYGITTEIDVSNDVLLQLQAYCGTGVELPTQEELMYMWIFKGSNSFQSGYYWSSAVDSSNSSLRLSVRLGDGITANLSASLNRYARAVREISLPEAD